MKISPKEKILMHHIIMNETKCTMKDASEAVYKICREVFDN
jgi:hypothetical protein